MVSLKKAGCLRKRCLLALALALPAVFSSCSDSAQGVPPAIQALRRLSDPSSPSAVASGLPRTSFTLWQLPPQRTAQNQSYVIYTPNRRLIVIDGGWQGSDTNYLREFISILGNRVHAWLVTHPHSDHSGALKAILESPDGIVIERIYASLNTAAWTTANEASYAASINAFLATFGATSVPKTEPAAGDRVTIDEVSIRFLGVKNPEITGNAVNNSSLVFKIWDAKKSVLFLGDLGVDGGNKLLAGPLAAELPSDYVQMAHHGQNGVTQAFYQAVHPTHCLWPTPLWLWNDDSGGGVGSGPWATLAVRSWMDTLGVATHYVSYAGLMRIE